MVVGTSSKGCQVAVIGGGPGGYLAAIRLAQLKKDVILIEESPSLGGVCLNEGCIPSKALIHAADFLEETQRVSRMGIDITDVRLDIHRLVSWKDKIVKQLTTGVAFLAQKNGAEVIHGKARFLTDRRLEVFTDTGPLLIEFEQAVIATGSVPIALPTFPVDGQTIIGARDALSPPKIPERLVIIGAGYVGLELGSVYQRFGSQVHILERSSEILSFHDPEVRQAISKRLTALGIRIHLGCTADRLEPGNPARIIIRNSDNQEIPLEADQILVCIGRTPNTHDLGLDSLHIKTSKGGCISVNERMETSVPGILAVGDVVGGPLLAHKAYREAKVAAEVIAGEPAAFDNIVIPAVVYTDPELAWAGLSEKEAISKGYRTVTGTFPFAASGRAMTLGAADGFVKTIGDADSKRILGVYIVGKDASEMIAEAALAIEMGAFLDDLSQTIHPHPTMSEGLLESVEAALGEAIHVLNKK